MSQDLTDGQESEDALKVALDFAESIIATLREPFVVLNRDLRVKMANRAFFESLIREFSPDPEEVGRAGDAYRINPSPEHLARLQKVVEPPRQELFRRLNQGPDGTRILVAMRSQVLQEADRSARLKPIAADLAHLFTSWFNRGFLVLRRIDWRTSAVILENVPANTTVAGVPARVVRTDTPDHPSQTMW